MKVITKKTNINNFIILEGGKRSVLPELREVKEFTRSLSKKAKEQFGSKFKFIITWGSAIGGILMPIENYLKTGGISLSDSDITLILIGVGSIIFFENEDKIKKIVSLIEEKKLMSTFANALSKGENLKKVFISFIDSLNVTLHTLTNILGYAFLIPILPLLLEFAKSGYSEAELKELLMRFVYFTSISISGITLKELVSKIVKRFRG
jgi:hypothetical protein